MAIFCWGYSVTQKQEFERLGQLQILMDKEKNSIKKIPKWQAKLNS